MKFVESVEKYIDDNSLLEDGDGIVIGLSGGADSVSLLLALTALRDRRKYHLAAVHLNHMIRGEEADRDEAFTRRLCEEREVEFISFREDIPRIAAENGQSEEEAGRIIRYELFEQVRIDKGFRKIAVAHNRNDLAETVLFNMARGSSLKGLSGISPKRGCIVRPLLGLTREEIEAYLESEGQDYVTDSTNSGTEYSRNLIRHEILPKLSRLNSEAAVHIARAAEDVNEIYLYVEEEAGRVNISRIGNRDEAEIRLADVKDKMTLVRYEVYLRAMESLAGRRKDITRMHLSLIDELTGLPNGRSLDMPYGITVRKSYDKLIFDKKEQTGTKMKDDTGEEVLQDETICERPVFINGDGRYLLGDAVFDVKILDYSENIQIPRDEYNKIFDYDRICGNLCFRYAEQDDFIMVTVDGHKKLSRVFTDKKIDREKRKRVPVLACGNEVIWAVGVRFSEGFKVNSSTKRVMIVNYIDFPEEG